jgi:hypothetical protein
MPGDQVAKLEALLAVAFLWLALVTAALENWGKSGATET